MQTETESIRRVAAALRKLTTAASSIPGRDCYTHAALGQALLERLGVPCRLVAGWAAWRVGPGDADVVAHHNGGTIPQQAGGLMYHAWIELAGDRILDFSTFQLEMKARELDRMDGGRTQVNWCPDYLLVSRSRVKTYREVAKSYATGVFHYQRDFDLESRLKATYLGTDPADLEMAWLLVQNPEVNVVGPNDMLQMGSRPRP